MVSVGAPAKLNLGLRILARRPDGYHEIETLFLPLDLCDRLEIEIRRDRGVLLETDDADLPTDERNLAVSAARRLCDALGREPRLRIRLEKRIPVAAGLGGGSSDAAATLRGLEVLLGRALPPGERTALALRLGADVPFLLEPLPAVGRGVGELIEPLPGVPGMWWLLVAFPFQVSSAAAYRDASAELTLPRRESSIAALLGPSGLLSSPRNDLETGVARRHPEIREARRALDQAGALASGMTGSGPTVYGRFEDREAAERAARRGKFPAGVRTIVTSSPGSDAVHSGWGVAKR